MRFDKRYDICFGIGEACVCSQVLRKAGLQKLSYPFDWVRYAEQNSAGLNE